MKTLKYLFIAALAIFSFNACEDVPTPYEIPAINGSNGADDGSNVSTPEGEGTLESPYNPAGANDYISKLEADENSDKAIYVKGIICSIKEAPNSQYGNATFYISADGKTTSEQFYVFRCYNLENKKFTDNDVLNVGDEVIIYGKVVNYRGNTPETVQNEAYIYSHSATTDEPEETVEMTVAEAIAAYSGTPKPAIVKGYIVGWVDGMNYSEGARFNGNVTEEKGNTDIILADSPDETDASKCIPVQLPSGDVRNKVNLQENPGNYKKAVTLTGSVEKYFGVPGLKSVTKALFEGEEESEDTPVTDAYINETFANDLGLFTTAQIVNDYAWKHEVYNSKAYAKVSGYANGASQDAESWLISPAFDLTSETAAQITFDYVINKGDANLAAANHQLMVTDSYTGDFFTTKWTAVDYGATNDNTWNFRSAKANLPTEFNGKSAVVIAFKYTSTTSASSTWEVNNVVVSGNAAGSDDNTGGDDNTGNDNTGGTAPAGSIAEILASPAGDATASGTVIATYARGFLVNDGTGSILVYLGNDTYKAGDVVIVTGTTSEYGGIMQFGNTATVEKTGTASVTLPTPTEMTGADLDAYINTPKTKYIQYTGTLSISGNYYNVNVDGASTAVGSISYPGDGLVDAGLNGKRVIVTGFAVGVSATKFVNTMATSVVAADGDDSGEQDKEEESLSTNAITVAQLIEKYNAGNTGAAVVTAYIVGTSEAGKSKFTPILGIENASNTNIIIADNPNETDTSKCIPVQLPLGAVRAGVNLRDNPGNLGKKITLTGEIQKYFGIAGFKNTTEYTIE